jgi:hypothetical protein
MARLGRSREKQFANTLTYKLPSLGIQITLPADWKIAFEDVLGDDSIEALKAVFSSQAVWTSDTRSPIDASVDFTYTRRSEDVAKSGEDFGIFVLKELNAVSKKSKVHWQPRAMRRELGNAVEFSWAFEVEGHWPKVGVLLAYEVENARIALRVLCQKSGKATLWPLLSSIIEDFSQNSLLTETAD